MSLHYSTLHYSTVQYSTLHYSTLHYRYGWDDQYYEYDEAEQWELEGWYQDNRGDWHQDPQLREYYQARTGKTAGYKHDSENNKDVTGAASEQDNKNVKDSSVTGSVTVSGVKDLNKRNTEPGRSSESYLIPYGDAGPAPSAKPSMRPKPPDYDSAWYEESDGQWYNQYDWYQDQAGQWAYDYRMEEYGYTQNEDGEWVAATDKSSDQNKESSKSLEKADSKDGFSQLFSSNKSASEPSKSVLPPRPADYHDYWYQDETGAWYNEYDDLGYQFAEDDDDLLVVKPGGKSETSREKVSSSSTAPGQSLPADYDTRWYQDEFGVVRNEYDELLQEREETFYSDDELSKHEEILRREEQDQTSSKPSKAVEQNKSVIDTGKSPESQSGSSISTKPPAEATPAKEAPAKEKKKLPKPPGYDDGWYQDHHGNWLNRLDRDDVEFEDVVPPSVTNDKKNVSFGRETAKEPVKEAVKEPVKEARQLRSGRTPRERWLWAYNKILQVGGRKETVN